MTNVIQRKPKVSVCIVTFNHVKYIKDCLFSTLMQMYDAELEILVGDDCSTDNTSDIIRRIAQEHPGLIKFYCHRSNIGPSENIKFLIEHASGEYISHLDGDDFWLPGKLERQLRFMDKHQECIAVYTNAVVVDKESILMGVFNNRQPEIQDINYLLRRGNYLNHSSLMYRSKAKKDILSINGDLLDYRIHCCLASRGNLGYLNSALVAYRSGAEGSLVFTTPDAVRKKIWDFLVKMHKPTVNSDALIDGMIYLIGHIFFDCFLRGRLSYVVQWTTQIHRDMPTKFYRILLLGVTAFISNGYKAVYGKLLAILSKNPLKVLHYR